MASANLMAAVTAVKFGFHFSVGPSKGSPDGVVWFDLPPRKKGKSPRLAFAALGGDCSNCSEVAVQS